MRYVDLTMGLSDHMEVWSGDPEVSLSVHTTIEEHGCRTMRIAMGTHNGTHIDSPAHLIPGGKSLDQVAVERFFARSYVLDTAGCALITREMVSDLPPGCTGILFCGADSYLDEGRLACSWIRGITSSASRRRAATRWAAVRCRSTTSSWKAMP